MAQTSDQGDGPQETSGAQTNSSTGTSNNSTNTTTADTAPTLIDKDFDPSAQALVDEIDDERTLEEEEALAGADSSVVQNELDDLKRESEMPIEELLAYYERMRNEAAASAAAQEDDDFEHEEDDEECEDDDEDCDEDEEDEDCDGETNEEPIRNDDHGGQNDVRPRQDTNPMVEIDEQAASSVGPRKPVLRELSLEEGGGFAMEVDENMFRALMDNIDSSDLDSSEGDFSYNSNDEYDDQRRWRRVIHVGPEYQAEVPDSLSEYETGLPPYENEDVLVWKCNPEQSQEEILDYLKEASVISKRNDISLSPASVPKITDHHIRLYRERTLESSSASSALHSTELNHENINNENPPLNQTDVYMLQSRKRLRIEHEIARDIAMGEVKQQSVENIDTDNPDGVTNPEPQDSRPELSTDEYFQGEEQLLYLLLQCNHNYKEALRRRTLNPFKYYISEPMSLWSQDECLGFEHGLRIYGKNFRLIRDNNVQTRSRAEVVAFYYLWKKSERHDVYTNQYKIDRKRCLTHPGTTDYMDKFIEDNESALNASSTPTPENISISQPISGQ